MSELPRIAVVTPSYNTGRYLGAAVQSVLGQDYPNVDYLVMDGGSDDNSLDVLRSFGDRVRWTSGRDGGQADAIVRGFEQTDGEILGWLNADDTYAPGAFAAVGEYFAAHPDVALVYGNANFIDADGSVIAPCVHVEPFDLGRLSYYSDFIAQPAAFFRRSAYESAGGLDSTLNWAMDWDLWLKLGRRFKAAYLPRHLANYRWLAETKTATGGFARIDEINAMLHRHGLGPAAYVCLEQVNLHLRDSLSSLGRGELVGSIRSAGRGAAALLKSPRAIRSMFQPRTWRIIWTGQVLRARAARTSHRSTGDQAQLNLTSDPSHPHPLECRPL